MALSTSCIDHFPLSPTTQRLEPADVIVYDGTCDKIKSLTERVDIETLELSSNSTSALTQITHWIEQFNSERDIDTLHLVAHGKQGAFRIADEWITAETLMIHSSCLARWRVKRIALWSCKVGAGSELASILAEHTGAEIWATEEKLGNKYGWQLQHGSSIGKPNETNHLQRPQPPFSREVMAEWKFDLVDTTTLVLDPANPSVIEGGVLTFNLIKVGPDREVQNIRWIGQPENPPPSYATPGVDYTPNFESPSSLNFTVQTIDDNEIEPNPETVLIGYRYSIDQNDDGDIDPDTEEFSIDLTGLIYDNDGFDLALVKNGVLDNSVVGPDDQTNVGDVINYTFTVTNTSSDTPARYYETVEITDSIINSADIKLDPTSDVGGDGKLSPGETWIFEASYEITPTDLENESVSNTATATGTALGGVTKTSPGSSVTTPLDVVKPPPINPSIDIDKVTSDGTSSGDGLTFTAGTPITWEYTITNDGNVTLDNPTVTDNQPGVTPTFKEVITGNNNDDFEPGEVWLYTASGSAVLGSYSNIGTATGTYEGETVSATDVSNYNGVEGPAPSLTINKVTSDGTSSGDGLTFTVGTPITWEYTITNNGNVTLDNPTVTDNQPGVTPTFKEEINGDNDDDFEPGEIWLYTASGSAVLGSYSNIGTATAAFAGETVSATDGSSYTGIPGGSAQLVITPDGNGLTVVGPKGSSLWVELLVTGAIANWQNTLTLVRTSESNGGPDQQILEASDQGPSDPSFERVGALGSTPIEPEVGYLGGKRYVRLEEGEVLNFVQSTAQLPENPDPNIKIEPVLVQPVLSASPLEKILYQQDFESPNGFINGGDDVSGQTVNELYSDQPPGFVFAQDFTVETLLIGGDLAWPVPANDPAGYKDPQGIGGSYAVSMLATAQDDLLGLSFNTEDFKFLNVRLDISSIDLNTRGGPFFDGKAPKFEFSLYDNPSGGSGLGSGIPLSTAQVTGTLAPNEWTFNWSDVALGLSTEGNTNGNVILRIDLLEGGYAAFDNLVISSSDTPASTAEYRLGLDDGGAGPDDDFNDLVLDIRTVEDPSSQPDYIIGTPQVDATAGLFDLTQFGGIDLALSVSTYSELSNTLRFVEVEVDAMTGLKTVAGIEEGTAGFLDAVKANLESFSYTLGGEGNSGSTTWEDIDAGLYAPVLITGNGDVLTFGASGGSDGFAHLKVLGQNLFSFEDLLADQGTDWDYNDFILQAQVAAVPA